jgi:hypothetical protein
MLWDGNLADLCVTGPRIALDHDLVALWERYTRTEFKSLDVERTMVTMVAQPRAATRMPAAWLTRASLE